MKYPDEHTLELIRTWKAGTNVDKLWELIEENWEFADVGYFKKRGKRTLYIQLHTGGWSGNEDIISAMQENFLLWSLYWEKSLKGGHYYFKVQRK